MPAPGSSSGAYKLGEAFVELKAKDSGFAKKILAAGAGVSSLTALLTTAATAAVNFEKQMARVSTMLVDGATKFLPGYAKGLQELSVRFADSTSSLTSGLYDILSATVPPSIAMEHLEVAARAATAGMTSTAVAAKTISGFMQAYNINATKAADVSDWMFEVVRRGLITFPELSAQLGQAAASASMIGVSMNELGAAISTVTRAGIPAGRTMTAINALMQAFLKPTELAQYVAKKYGFEMSVATIRQKGFLGVLKALQKAGAQEVGAVASRIRGIRALSALVMNLSGFQSDLTFQTKRTGRTQEAFAKMAATTAFKLGQLRESVKRVAVAFGSLLLPRIKIVTDWLGRLLKKVYQLSPAVKKMAVDFALLTPAVLVGWLTLSKVVDRIARPLKRFAGVVLFPLKGVSLLTKSIGGLINVFGSLIPYVGKAIGSIGKLVGVLGPLIERLTVPLVKMTIGPALMGIVGIAGFSIWDKFRKASEKGIAGIFNAFKRFADWFKKTYGESFQRIIINLKKAWQGLSTTVGEAITKLLNKWTDFNNEADKSKDLFTRVTDAIVRGFEKVSVWINFAANNMGLVLDLVANEATMVFTKIEHYAKSFAGKMIQTFILMGKELAKSLDVKTIMINIQDWINNATVELLDWMSRPALMRNLNAATASGNQVEMLKAVDALRKHDTMYKGMHTGDGPSSAAMLGGIWSVQAGDADVSGQLEKRKSLLSNIGKAYEHIVWMTRLEAATQKVAARNEAERLKNKEKWEKWFKGSIYNKIYQWFRALKHMRPRVQLGAGDVDKEGIGGGGGGLSGGQRAPLWMPGRAMMGGGKPQDKVAMNVNAHRQENHADFNTLIKVIGKLVEHMKKPKPAPPPPPYHPNTANAIAGTFA